MSTDSREAVGPSGWRRRPEYLAILLIAIVYVALIGRYRAFDLDDVWFLSFSHSFWVQHIPSDTFMHQPFPEGMGGVVAFGKLAAIIQGIVLNALGWSLASGIVLTIAFATGSLILIAMMCRQLGYSSHFTTCYMVLLGLSEPFVAAAEKTRFEFLALFFLSLALWLASRKSVALAMFVAAMATEVEPVAIVIPFAVMATILIQNRGTRTIRWLLPRIAFGAACATVVYFLLHPHIIEVARSARWGAVSDRAFPGGFAVAYFVHYKRHLPDLLLLLAAIGVSLALPSRRHLLTQWPAVGILTICIVSALLRWGNIPYFCFLSPFFCLFIMQALYGERYWKGIVAVILLMMLPQYAYRGYYWSTRPADLSQQDQRRVSEAIDRASALIGKPSEQVNLIGNFTLMFAHPSHFTNLDARIMTPAMIQDSDLILCFDKPLDPILAADINFEVACPRLDNTSRMLETMALDGHELQIRAPTIHR